MNFYYGFIDDADSRHNNPNLIKIIDEQYKNFV